MAAATVTTATATVTTATAGVSLEQLQTELQRFAWGAMREALNDILRVNNALLRPSATSSSASPAGAVAAQRELSNESWKYVTPTPSVSQAAVTPLLELEGTTEALAPSAPVLVVPVLTDPRHRRPLPPGISAGIGPPGGMNRTDWWETSYPMPVDEIQDEEDTLLIPRHPRQTKSDANRSGVDDFEEDEPLEFYTHIHDYNNLLSQNTAPLHSGLPGLVEHQCFEMTVAVFLLLNALLLGWEADYEFFTRQPEMPYWAWVAEKVFCVVFTIELVLRICVYRTAFFTNEHWKWNLFDTFMVLLQLVDQAVQLATNLNVPMNLTVLRVLRCLRVVRIARALRITRFFSELRSIVSSISSTLTAVCWALLLLVLVVYCFSVLFLQAAGDAITTRLSGTSGSMEIPQDRESAEHMVYWFGGLLRTMVTMVECIFGGATWDDVIGPVIRDISPVLGFAFIFYTSSTICVLLNLVTGLFVEKVTETVREDKDGDLALRICNLFLADKKRSSHEVTLPEFNVKMQSQTMQDFFRAIDVHPSVAKDLFELLDFDASGSVSASEIVSGCLRLKGPAKSLDIAILMRTVDSIHAIVSEEREMLEGAKSRNARASARRTAAPMHESKVVRTGK